VDQLHLIGPGQIVDLLVHSSISIQQYQFAHKFYYS
jgi:hypothetical protein